MSTATDIARAFDAGLVKTALTNWLALRQVVAKIYTPLANIVTAKVVDDLPGFAGAVTAAEAHVGFSPATTSAKAATLTVSIAGVAITAGGAMALTSANMTPAGNVVAATAITQQNFSATQRVGVVSSAVTAFVEGDVLVNVFGLYQ